MSRRCVACLGWRGDHACEGLSSLYSPNTEFILCEPCWEKEDAFIDAEGDNDHPEIVAAYASGRGWDFA